MGANSGSSDRQTQTKATAVGRLLQPFERLEDSLQRIGRNSSPLITDLELKGMRGFRRTTEGEGHRLAGLGESNRIAQHGFDGLAEKIWIDVEDEFRTTAKA